MRTLTAARTAVAVLEIRTDSTDRVEELIGEGASFTTPDDERHVVLRFGHQEHRKPIGGHPPNRVLGEFGRHGSQPGCVFRVV
jgi:hypothetical protein